jgi:hypothetical protein
MEVKMAKERRTMKRGKMYEIEEKDNNREWQVVCRCETIEEAKALLRNLKVLDAEAKNG